MYNILYILYVRKKLYNYVMLLEVSCGCISLRIRLLFIRFCLFCFVVVAVLFFFVFVLTCDIFSHFVFAGKKQSQSYCTSTFKTKVPFYSLIYHFLLSFFFGGGGGAVMKKALKRRNLVIKINVSYNGSFDKLIIHPY